ncbi:ABC transporter-like protein (plasmid) [Aureimonas sp. AU20]|nr:ATP-binding cassette domain-containing protein [Aureimonas sp. AU20]ALN75417.1 ABC transporter-like protein [Aureimonas sp. AU20]
MADVTLPAPSRRLRLTRSAPGAARGTSWGAWPLLLVATLSILVPMATLVLYSLATRWTSNVLPDGYTLSHWAQGFADPRFREVLWRSLWLAVLVAVIEILLVAPVVYWQRVRNPAIRPVLETLAAIPFAMPLLVIAFGLLRATGDDLPAAQGTFGSPLKLRGASAQRIRQRADELLEMVGLTERADHPPNQLSGGQQQRTALARALAADPAVLLLDEPLSALDAVVRDHLRDEIRRIQQSIGITAILVTHDQAEALAVADRVVVMRAGRIEQVAAPAELYDRPTSAFSAGFIGGRNRFDLAAENGEARLGAIRFPAPSGASRAGVFVCAEDVRRSAEGRRRGGDRRSPSVPGADDALLSLAARRGRPASLEGGLAEPRGRRLSSRRPGSCGDRPGGGPCLPAVRAPF